MHDVSIPAAVLAGLISFLSPCVLPLVPPYLIYLTGATIEHVANDGDVKASKRAVMASADRKSTRLNSSHDQLSYAVFCLKTQTQTYGPAWPEREHSPNGGGQTSGPGQ